MNTILVVAMTGQGKSTYLRKKFGGRNSYVFDPQREYPAPFRVHPDLNQKNFVAMALQQRKCNIIAEEATGFFRGRQSDETMQLLVNKRHHENNIIFVFHALRLIPPSLVDMANYLVLFNTNDSEQEVKRKFPQILPFYLDYHRTKQKSHVYRGSQIYAPKEYKLI